MDSEGNNIKWKIVSKNLPHLFYAILFGSLAMLPQIIYWVHTTGDLIYNVGSKWQFHNPFFRVLFGEEKGWFIYTPVTIFFILSLLLIRNYNFKNSLLVFSFLNIWIVISWFDWRYGGSYSTRALSHSLPMFSLSLGALIMRNNKWRFKHLLYFLFSYLAITNLFQIYQYNKSIIHYNDMNIKYYKQIYWNLKPSSLDYSLLDTGDWAEEDKLHHLVKVKEGKENLPAPQSSKMRELIFLDSIDHVKFQVLKTQIKIAYKERMWEDHLISEIWQNGDQLKIQKFRLDHPDDDDKLKGKYEYFTIIPESCLNCRLSISLKNSTCNGIDSINYILEGMNGSIK